MEYSLFFNLDCSLFSSSFTLSVSVYAIPYIGPNLSLAERNIFLISVKYGHIMYFFT